MAAARGNPESSGCLEEILGMTSEKEKKRGLC